MLYPRGIIIMIDKENTSNDNYVRVKMTLLVADAKRKDRLVY
jgi:hypothetical protein